MIEVWWDERQEGTFVVAIRSKPSIAANCFTT